MIDPRRLAELAATMTDAQKADFLIVLAYETDNFLEALVEMRAQGKVDDETAGIVYTLLRRLQELSVVAHDAGTPDVIALEVGEITERLIPIALREMLR